MGFDCALQLKRYKKSDMTPHTPITLYFFGNPGDALDHLIMKHCEKPCDTIESFKPIIGDKCIVVDYKQVQIHNDGYEYPVSKAGLEAIRKVLAPAYKICQRYSERVIEELTRYLDGDTDYYPMEVTKQELSQIKDCLYEIAGDWNEPELYSVINVYTGITAVCMLDDDVFEEEKIVYVRSW